jgi:hypothetical protein
MEKPPMATKTAKAKPEEVGVMFKAPHEIRGSIRSISAWAEMNGVRINGKVPAEKDIWAWLAASLYQSGEDSWRDALVSGSKAYADLIGRN